MRSSLWKIVIIAVLTVALVRPAPAESLDTAGKQIYAGIAIVGAAAVVGVIFLVRHERHKPQTITGCIDSGPAGIMIKEDNGGKVYTLSGDLQGFKSGDKMTLKGKRNGKVFRVQSVIKDLGVC